MPEVQAELMRHFSDIRIYPDGRLRLEGTLDGLLQGKHPLVRIANSGGRIRY